MKTKVSFKQQWEQVTLRERIYFEEFNFIIKKQKQNLIWQIVVFPFPFHFSSSLFRLIHVPRIELPIVCSCLIMLLILKFYQGANINCREILRPIKWSLIGPYTVLSHSHLSERDYFLHIILFSNLWLLPPSSIRASVRFEKYTHQNSLPQKGFDCEEES